MFTLLAKKIIKNYKDYSDPAVREKYGLLSGVVGIVLNLMLASAKAVVGFLSGSISIFADALNNFTDAGSSIVTYVGFKLSAKQGDREHPFGHGRMEYVSGLIVSMLIFFVGFELIKSSAEKIFEPEPTKFSVTLVIILVVSVLVKLYMFAYNAATAKKINSAAMRATALDSVTDCIATTVVLISALIDKWTGLNVDAYAGLLVALFIIWTGVQSAKETIGLLVGDAPDPKLVREIEKTVMSDDCVLGLHDLMVHSYGAGKNFISLHAEVSADEDILTAHDRIDNLERELEKKFNCVAVIHMDPVAGDERTAEVKSEVVGLLKEINPKYTLHDFRIVEGPTHTNLIFDVVVPPDDESSPKKIVAELEEKIKSKNQTYNLICQVEKAYAYDE